MHLFVEASTHLYILSLNSSIDRIEIELKEKLERKKTGELECYNCVRASLHTNLNLFQVLIKWWKIQKRSKNKHITAYAHTEMFRSTTEHEIHFHYDSYFVVSFFSPLFLHFFFSRIFSAQYKLICGCASIFVWNEFCGIEKKNREIDTIPN